MAKHTRKAQNLIRIQQRPDTSNLNEDSRMSIWNPRERARRAKARKQASRDRRRNRQKGT